MSLRLLNKDELIHLITILERDIRKEYENFTILSEEDYNMTKNLFKKLDVELTPIENFRVIHLMIHYCSVNINPVTLKLEFSDLDPPFQNININDILIKGIKRIIAISKTVKGNIYYDNDDDYTRRFISLSTVPKGNGVTFKDILEVIFRLRKDKNGDEDIEQFSHFRSHIDEKGTLFMEVNFVNFTDNESDDE